MTVAQTLQNEATSDRACFSVSDQGLLAYHAGLGESQLTWFDRSGNRVGTLGPPALFRGVELAPDGRNAAILINNASGGSTAWIYDLERGLRTRLSSASSPYTGVAWSPDGKRVAMSGQKDGAYVINDREVGGSAAEELTVPIRF